MARPEKIARVERVAETIKNARSVILNDFTGLDVAKISELRRLCRENGIEFRVVKNTLAKRGIKDTPAEGLSEYFEGPTAIAVSTQDENSAAKVLAKFAEEHEAPKFKAGFVDGNVIDATAVLALSKLPSKEELLSMILAGIKSPASGLVGVLQGPLRNLVSVLNQIKEKESE
jgi:large subunit ribosomal protein L10